MSFIEPLEARVAPAVIVNATTLNYFDQDGDLVTVKFSVPLLKTLGDANGIFTFNTGSVVTSPDATHQQLELITLGASAAGTSITVTVKHEGAGDGYAAVGYINAACPLGAVSINGDLGGITAGTAVVERIGHPAVSGVTSLSVLSMGEYGFTTQEPSGGSYIPSLTSTITGLLGGLSVKTDVFNAAIGAESMGTIKIGGSLTGGTAVGSGSIVSAGGMGAISIGGDVAGGSGMSSGDITAAGKIASIKIGGSLIGASGTGSPSSSSFSGYIYSAANMGPVSIGQSVEGGHFDESGKIQCGAAMTSLTVGGSILGGDGDEATSGTTSAQGEIAVTTTLGAVKIRNDVTGGAGYESGGIRVYGTAVGALSVGGDITGGAADRSGSIVSFGTIGAVTIRGSIIGGGSADPNGDAYAGEVYAVGKMGALKIGGSIIGGVSGYSGQIEAGALSSVAVGGSLIGGSAEDAGEITTIEYPGGTAGAITIGGSIRGGSAYDTGTVDIEGGAPSVQIGGSIVAGPGAPSGGVMTDGSFGSVVVKGSVVGTTAEHAFIDAIGFQTGVKSPKTDVAIKSITIGGSLTYGDILGGQDGDHLGDSTYQNGSAQLGAIKIGDDYIGSNVAAGAAPPPGVDGYGENATLLPTSTGQITSVIASITIGGQAIGTATGDTSGTVYGIVAQEIEAVKIDAVAISLKAGPGNDTTPIPLGITSGLNLYELGVTG